MIVLAIIGAYLTLSIVTMFVAVPHLLARQKIDTVSNGMIISFFWPALFLWGLIASAVWLASVSANYIQRRANRIADSLQPKFLPNKEENIYREAAKPERESMFEEAARLQAEGKFGVIQRGNRTVIF